MATVPNKYMLKNVNRELVDAIAARTSLDPDQIEEIEEKLGIKAAPPKIYFGWERGEKVGWQFFPYKFVSKTDLDRRDERLDSILK